MFEYCNSGFGGSDGFGGVTWLAQTFSTTAFHSVNLISLEMYKGTASPGTLTVSIRATDANGHPTGSDLTSGTINANTFTNSSSGKWYNVTVTQYWLSRNTEYAIVCRVPSTSGVYWIFSSNGAGSLYSINNGQSWASLGTGSFMFEIWGYYDLTPPTYSGISHSTSYAGFSCNFNITANDNVQLGSYIFSTNNTGFWLNNTVVSFTSTPQTVTATKTLTSIVGASVRWKWFIYDVAGNLNATSIQSFTTLDGTPPSFSYLTYNTTKANTPCAFGVTITDNVAVSKYKFCTNNTGSWANTTGSFSSNPVTVTKTLNSTVGKLVQWKWYANDTSNNWAVSTTQSLTTTSATIPAFSSISRNTTKAGFTCTFSVSISSSGATISQYRFSTNNTGTWINQTGTWSANPVTVTITLNSGIGKTVQSRWYANDSNHNWGVSALQSFVTIEGTPPSYSQITYSTTTGGALCTFGITASDPVALNTFTFAYDPGTGVLSNVTTLGFSSDPQTVTVSETLPTTGATVRWQWYISNPAGNAILTSVQSFTTIFGTIPITPPTVTPTVSPTVPAVLIPSVEIYMVVAALFMLGIISIVVAVVVMKRRKT
jgi:hypothetical protein